MKDPEFIDLKNRFLLGVGICILLLVPFFFFMRNKLADINQRLYQELIIMILLSF